MKTIIAILISLILNYIGCVLFIYLLFERDGTGWLGATSNSTWFQISLMVAVIPGSILGILSGVILSQQFRSKSYLVGIGLGIVIGVVFFLLILLSTEMKANLSDVYISTLVSAINIISNLFTQFAVKLLFVSKRLS
jgi:hypothetical protein